MAARALRVPNRGRGPPRGGFGSARRKDRRESPRHLNTDPLASRPLASRSTMLSRVGWVSPPGLRGHEWEHRISAPDPQRRPRLSRERDGTRSSEAALLRAASGVHGVASHPSSDTALAHNQQSLTATPLITVDQNPCPGVGGSSSRHQLRQRSSSWLAAKKNPAMTRKPGWPARNFD